MPSGNYFLKFENYRTRDHIVETLGAEAVAAIFDQALDSSDFARSTNRKISPIQRYRLPDEDGERYDTDLVQAALGMASGPDFSCPGATKFCSKDCYSINAEQSKEVIGAKMRRNYERFRDAPYEVKVATLVRLLLDYNEKCERRGVPVKHRIFRFGWSGDVMNEEHAQAIAEAMTTVSQLHNENDGEPSFGISAAIYTRTYLPHINAVPHLVGVDNLNLYISVDPENWERALEVYLQDPGRINLSFLGTDYKEGIVLVRKFAEAAGSEHFDPEKLPSPKLNEDGWMEFNHKDVIICPEEFPYRKKDRRTGERKYLDLNVPILEERVAEEAAARAEGRDYDPNNVALRGACAHCMACYGDNPKDVVFAKNKVLDLDEGGPQEFLFEPGMRIPVRGRTGAVLAGEGARTRFRDKDTEEPPTLFN